MSRQRIEPQAGRAFVMSRGDYLRVIDPLGEQVADFVAFARADQREWLSSGRTLDYNNTIYPTIGHVLYSNRSAAMLTITADTVGRHDFLYTPCSQETFDILYKCDGHHPSCLENLVTNLRPFGIEADQIPTTFNIFMNVEIARRRRPQHPAAAFEGRRLSGNACRGRSRGRPDCLFGGDVQQLSVQADRVRTRWRARLRSAGDLRSTAFDAAGFVDRWRLWSTD